MRSDGCRGFTMSAEILTGGPVAETIDQKTEQVIQALYNYNVTAHLAMLRIGEEADDISYQKAIERRCGKLGIETTLHVFPTDVSQNTIIQTLGRMNSDIDVSGILVFRPVPKSLNEFTICEAVKAKKDVDGITMLSSGGVYTGKNVGYPPCTAEACMRMLQYYNIPLDGKKVAVVGRSPVIGRPVAMMLLRANATVTICHSHTRNLAEELRKADIIIAAAGSPRMIGRDCVTPEQVILDVGINWLEEEQRIVGDVDFDAVVDVVKAISPVPGGIGSISSAMLASHTAEAARRTVEFAY